MPVLLLAEPVISAYFLGRKAFKEKLLSRCQLPCALRCEISKEVSLLLLKRKTASFTRADQFFRLV